jgi:amino acid transporter
VIRGAAPGQKGLRSGALGLLSSVVIGVGATAPGFGFAAVLGFLAAAVGLQAPAILVVAFLPMLCISAAYYYLNRADPDCGTTFSWATRAFGPRVGWMGGWGILVSGTLVQANLAQISGRYTFLLLGFEGAAESTVAVTLLGVFWLMAMALICLIGIELSARTQWVLLGAELLTLLIFSAVALARVYTSPAGRASRPSIAWFDPAASPSLAAFASAMLLALFLYWGWDNAVSANEETREASRTPGRAAVLSTLILLLVYVVVAVAAQAYAGPAFLVEHRADVLSALGARVWGSPLDKLLIFAVLTSAAASAQMTLLANARTSLSMATKGAFPKVLARVHPRFQTPSVSTIWGATVAILWYVGLTALSENILYDGILALGLMIAFYYGLTGLACPILYRKELLKSGRSFLCMGVAPTIGAAVLAWAFAQSCIDLANPAKSTAGQAWLGVGPPLLIGIGFLLLGGLLMLLWERVAPEFFRRRPETAGAVLQMTVEG